MFESLVRRLEPFAREFLRRGKQIHLVGGAVRNLLLGRQVQDLDFTTDALPEEVTGYFKKVLPTGLKHGTVTVLFQNQTFEVTTFRVDGGYSDARRPDSVAFTPSLEEDLKRRDFTINAMALNLGDGSLTDPHDGRGDLARGLLRTVGDPGTRFDEDALRVLRLFRFAAQLGFAIDPAALAAVVKRRSRVAFVSRERVRVELVKAMAGPYPDLAWKPLTELGFLADAFAPVVPSVLKPASWERLRALKPDLRWPWWLTVACGAQDQWESLLKTLTFSGAEIDAFTGPAKALGYPNHPSSAKAVIAAWGSRDRAARGAEYLAALEAEGWRDDIGLRKEVTRAAASGEPIFLNELAVGGKELIVQGVPPGPRLGELLKALQREVWANPSLNEPTRLLERLRDLA